MIIQVLTVWAVPQVMHRWEAQISYTSSNILLGLMIEKQTDQDIDIKIQELYFIDSIAW